MKLIAQFTATELLSIAEKVHDNRPEEPEDFEVEVIINSHLVDKFIMVLTIGYDYIAQYEDETNYAHVEEWYTVKSAELYDTDGIRLGIEIDKNQIENIL